MADEEPRAGHAIEVVDVPSHGDSIGAGRDTQNGAIYVSIRRVRDNLGITVRGQLERLKGYHWATVTMMLSVAQDGKPRKLAFLPLVQVPP